ncbi:MAG: asparaginase [Acidimicrobiia bacterium]|nr:asparaginase [Acidimicrobiia bacterium]
MRLATIRSNEIESTHDVSVVAVDEKGHVVRSWGEPDIHFYYRSAIKPFQATVTLEAGASLTPEELAVVCASHGGYPIHLGLVQSVLRGAGLDDTSLQSPHAWPRDPAAKDFLIAAGHRRMRRLYHNCSGKHSGWLAACAAQGWPLDSYLDPDHPIQQRVLTLIEDVTGVEPSPIGVDGCGAPTPRGNLIGLARAFGKLSVGERFTRARSATQRFPALVASNTLPDGQFAAWWGGPVKVGAQGLIAAGRHGVGLAAKSHEGSMPIAVAAIVEAVRRLGLISDIANEALIDVARIPVFGGGRRVGTVEPLLDRVSAS